MNDADTTVARLKDLMARFVASRQWNKYHRPKNLAMSLAVEAAELMEHFQWLDHEQAEALFRRDSARRQIADEMADVLAFLLSLANCTGVDLSSAFEAKMRKNERKYPVDRVKGRYKRPRRRQD